MPRKKQDLKPDIILKNYWNDKEQFADLFNAVLFQGKQLIKAEELEDIDTEESTVLEHKQYAESIKASRDVIKIQKKIIRLRSTVCIIGFGKSGTYPLCNANANYGL